MKQGSLLSFFKPKGSEKRTQDERPSLKIQQQSQQNQQGSQNKESPKQNESPKLEIEKQQKSNLPQQSENDKQKKLGLLNKLKKMKKLRVDSSSSDDEYQPDVYMDQKQIEEDLEELHKPKNQKKGKNNMSLEESYSSASESEEEFKIKKKKQVTFDKKTTKPQQTQKNTTKTNTMSQSTGKKTGKESQMTDVDFFNEKETALQSGGAVGNISQLEDQTPYWATKEFLKDKNGKKFGEEGYDPTTLYVPQDQYAKLTSTKKQYWDIKKNNFDKIVFFKLGKFYELFYDDALITNIHLDLNWMGNKMHTGFPEKCLEKYATNLVEMGYKVAVVEQMETPKQMEERIKQQKKKNPSKKVEKCVNRDVCQVFTKGTFSSENDLTYQPRYMMSVRSFDNNFGVTIVEASTGVVTLGFVKDDANFTTFKTLLYQVKPQEIVYDSANVSNDIVKIFKSGYVKPVLSVLKNYQNQWHAGVAFNHLEKVHGQYEDNQWPKNLSYFYEKSEQRDLVFQSLSGCYEYLDSILLLENVLKTARYTIYDPVKGVNNTMILDSQCLQHLEILEGSLDPNKPLEGSLLNFLDKTVSPFGKRQIKNWICAPLKDIDRINERFDAIEDLNNISAQRDLFRQKLGKLPDIDRMLARIFKYAAKNSKQDQAIMFENISVTRLSNFKEILKNIKKAYEILQDTLVPQVGELKSKRLRKLLTQIPKIEEDLENQQNKMEEENNDKHQIKQRQIIKDEEKHFMFAGEEGGNDQKCDEGLLPDILEYVEDFEQYVIWKDNYPHPIEGIVPAYDEAYQKVQGVEDKLKEYLKQIQNEFKDRSIQYDHSKFRYQLEIQDAKIKGNKKPQNFEFTSSKKGFQRFHTPEIKELIEELEEAENLQKEQLGEFTQFLFKLFADNYKVWDSLIQILSELDCLCSLSITSFYAEGSMCRPKITYPLDGKVFMDIKEARHPCLQTQGVNFIPNDVVLGCEENEGKNMMLLTGPNMGGKSTSLRMSCIIAIMAQVGCYVPAESCEFTIVDRIFTRIGASDRLVEGKSTFYIEMEETLNAVKYGTMHSLIIMDELGRGTSTYDGVAIAYSILKYVTETLKCRCLFATHYHILLEEFANAQNVCFYNMACHVDPKQEKVIFLYKLKQGTCQNSFGINVAKVVGIDNSIIEMAKLKAKQFEDELSIQRNIKIQESFYDIMNTLYQNNNQNENTNNNNKNLMASQQLQSLIKAFDNSVGLITPKKQSQVQ